MKHIVQFSTGAGSAEVAYRVVERYGAADTVLLTADTSVEDEDNWRFAADVVIQLGCQWVIRRDGRTPMGVGRDERCVPNNRMAVCSRVLKRELLRKYMDRHFDPKTSVYGHDVDCGVPGDACVLLRHIQAEEAEIARLDADDRLVAW